MKHRTKTLYVRGLDRDHLNALRTLHTKTEHTWADIAHAMTKNPKYKNDETLEMPGTDAETLLEKTRAKRIRENNDDNNWIEFAMRSIEYACALLTKHVTDIEAIEAASSELALSSAMLRDGQAVLLGRTASGDKFGSATTTVRGTPEEVASQIRHMAWEDLWIINGPDTPWLIRTCKHPDQDWKQ